MEPQIVTGRILETTRAIPSLNRWDEGERLRQLCLEGFLGLRCLETLLQGTCEEDEGLPLAVLALRAGGILAVSSPAAVFPGVRARGVHQL